ncbi:MAG: pyroglutamyl-peptidase I [Deltaproteobacteria bacterium]|nr:pyroglutamyl-peptidase I [Deltaproteobacteria bacterium]
MHKILISGFGDWAGSSANPAEAVAKALDGKTVTQATINTVIAPSIFAEMIDAVTKEIDRISPDIVIMLGEFNGRSMLTVERLAQNLIDATRYDMGDEVGSRPQGKEIVSGGPVAYRATLPIRAMVKAMRRAGIPSDISDTAGTFGCNLLMYGVLHYIAQRKLHIRAGWIHLPSLPATAALEANIGMPSMSLETQVEGLKAAIAAIVQHEKDIDEPIRSQWQL